jgi:RHS repeat-associated protein
VVQATYRTDSLGQQVVRHLVQDGQVLHALHGPDGNRIAEYLYDPVSGASELLREYVWMDGRAVAVVEGGEVFFVRTDHIGRPVFATDSDGLKVWEASYLPFGGVHVSTGAINLRFPGQWFQSESGLHQNWMRDYDPTTGRYLQADPLGLVDGASVYGYALGNPGRWVDPRGEAAQAVCAAFPQACAAAGAAIVKICVEGAKIVAGAALALVTTTEEACGCEDDCEYEQPLSRLRKLSSRELGSRLIDFQSQNMTVAASATADRKVLAHLS